MVETPFLKGGKVKDFFWRLSLIYHIPHYE